MSSTYRNRTKTADQRTADEVSIDQALMCSAHGCPNRWTSNFDSPLCLAHARANPHHWPQVTQEQLDIQTELALRKDRPKPPTAVQRMSLAEKRAVLQRARGLFRPQQNPRAWAERLRAREESGERLSLFQREAWRAAIREPEAIRDVF